MTPEMPGGYGRRRSAMTLEITDRAPLALLPFLYESADSLLEDAGKLSEAEIRAPSSLPGWSRAHVLAHLAGGSDSRVRLLVAARTGLPIPQYPGERSRAEQIARDARRPVAELLDLLRFSTTKALTAIRDHPQAAWNRPVRWLGGSEHPVHRVVSSQLQELEIHHVDLKVGYTPDDWPGWFAADLCRTVVADLAGREDIPGMRMAATDEEIRHDFGPGPLVTGRSRALLAWLIGRGDGAELTVTPAGPLPEPPPWRR
ncbi:maleylpyruvate isomerase family mycothiol-dependent enzyme [Streptosporangium sp. NPDC051022]|uniref:maleylpyruvate isomerase family mycothiol-dependent enzyme n=1 Tax=Streptosporangium sp. NPDC051022 TaxID=3155752 RepID=UPI003436FC9F